MQALQRSKCRKSDVAPREQRYRAVAVVLIRAIRLVTAMVPSVKSAMTAAAAEKLAVVQLAGQRTFAAAGPMSRAETPASADQATPAVGVQMTQAAAAAFSEGPCSRYLGRNWAARLTASLKQVVHS